MRHINLIVVHCSATPPTMDIGVEEIRKWHSDPKPEGNGWSDIGYHYVIRRDGEIEIGRPIERAGAHSKGHNSNSIGICLIGGVDSNGSTEDNFNAQQYDSLHELLLQLTEEYSVPLSDVCGHRDLSPDVDGDGEVEEHEWIKDCPSFDVRDWVINY